MTFLAGAMPAGAARAGAWLVSVSPTTPPGELDPTSVSPGVVGFLATFAVALVSVGLFVGMSRRLRRVRYRAEHDGPSQGDATGRPERPQADPEEPAD